MVRGLTRLLDHGNEWCAREPTYEVIFCFNKHSGYVHPRLSVCKVIQFYVSRYGGYSDPKWGRGVRSIVFHSTAPLEGIETYVMMEDGTSHARVILDEFYM